MLGGFRMALQFLTQLPDRTESPSAQDIASSYYFYPLIGLFIGGAAVLLRFVLAIIFPMPFAIVLVLAFLVWISGGLHEDGLADVADGMGGGWTVEQRLRIMKDSHIGAFGALALVLAVLIKYVALTSMNPLRIDGAIVTAQILGRWAFLPLGYFNRPAREGLGSQFIKGIRINSIVVTAVFSSALVVLIGGVRGIVAFALAAMFVFLASIYFRSRIGGVTGDCFGAAFQLVEIATYATFLA
jgi:adenosylcobinamide-GDP ribazoletransferase